jgi:predicted SnoaL-like aldol condensation-catalyzing enzyme
MTGNVPLALAHRMHDAFNARDIAAVDEIFAPDFYSHPLRAGRDAVRAAWSAIIAAYPRARSAIEDVLVGDNRVALRATVSGLSAEDDASPVTLIEFFRVADGRIAELWGARSDSTDSELRAEVGQ